MKSARNYITVVLGLVVLAGSSLAWMQYQELIKLRAQLLDPNERADLQKRLADSQKNLRDLQDQLAASRGRRGTTDVAADDRPPQNADGGRRFGGGPMAWQAMVNDPKFQKLMALQQKATLDTHYAALFKTLNLTPQQIDQFKNLLVEKQQAVMDAMNAAREQGVTPRSDPEAFSQAVAQAQAAVDAQIQAQLGPDGYNTYQQYVQSIPAQNTVSQVQQALNFTDPLSSTQASALAQIIQQNAPQRAGNGTAGTAGGPPGAGGGFGGFFGNANQTVPVTEAAVAQATSSGLFDSTQLQELQQQQAASAAAAAARQAAQEARAAAAQQATANSAP